VCKSGVCQCDITTNNVTSDEILLNQRIFLQLKICLSINISVMNEAQQRGVKRVQINGKRLAAMQSTLWQHLQ
jgi:hypothetical protein